MVSIFCPFCGEEIDAEATRDYEEVCPSCWEIFKVSVQGGPGYYYINAPRRV